MMNEKPCAKTPWKVINSLLLPEERFEVKSDRWQGFLFAPKDTAQLASLLKLISQDNINVLIQGRGSRVVPSTSHQAVISMRAFSHMSFQDHNIVETGAGCSLSQFNQFLFENNRESPFANQLFEVPKRTIAGWVLAGEDEGTLYRGEPALAALLGAEMMSMGGSSIAWGSHYPCAFSGPSLHRLLWGFNEFPGVIVKFFFKTYVVIPFRLQLAWKIKNREDAWYRYHKLKEFSITWESLDLLFSGNKTDNTFIFGQISGLEEEMATFGKICPYFHEASQKEEKNAIRKYLMQLNLNSMVVDKHHQIESGEYLWIQHGARSARLLTPKHHSRQGSKPGENEWKKFVISNWLNDERK